jgi:hypothetical protein
LQQIAGQAPRLQLEVISSAFMDKGGKLYINAMGLEGDVSQRDAKDGYTYFGCKKSITIPANSEDR